MAKERNFNPVQAQRKADKAKAVKKGKAEAQDRRNEKFAKKNPERIQKQVDDLKAVTTNGGKLSKHEEQVLEGLEKELKAVNKAREALGDRAPTFSRGGRGGGGWNRDQQGSGHRVLGKRRRGSNASTSDDEDVPDEVRKIPMPRDTPPPIPKDVLDQWYAKRRARREAENASRRSEREEDNAKKAEPAAEAKTVYSAEPVRRDLRQEAVAAFVPTAVKMKMDKGRGVGGLMEPEEADKLEQEGYLQKHSGGTKGVETAGGDAMSGGEPTHPRTVTVEEVDDEG